MRWDPVVWPAPSLPGLHGEFEPENDASRVAASRRAASVYLAAANNLALEKQKGKEEEMAATQAASAAALVSLAAVICVAHGQEAYYPAHPVVFNVVWRL